MQEYYRQQGYVVGGSGAVEFFYVAFRTNKRTGQIEICLNKNLAWSNTLHDPARMMLTWPAQDATYTYGRLGPMPNRAVAEASAVQYATRLFGDPTRYGFWIVSGGIKQPSFS